MFTLNQSYEEILSKEPVGRAVGNLFPSCWMQRITPDHAQDAMCYIAETVRNSFPGGRICGKRQSFDGNVRKAAVLFCSPMEETTRWMDSRG